MLRAMSPPPATRPPAKTHVATVIRTDEARRFAYHPEAHIGVPDAGGYAAALPDPQIGLAARPRPARHRILHFFLGHYAVLEAGDGVVRIGVHHLPDVAGHIVEAVAVRPGVADGLDPLAPLGEGALAVGVVVGLAGGRSIAPRIPGLFVAAARGVLEFGRSRQAVDAAFLAAAPLEVVRHVVPVHEDHRMVFHSGGNGAL
jgi:hypothetical protein